ncbi:MAG: shikimate kinase, partial [Thermoplasmata archaeon]
PENIRIASESDSPLVRASLRAGLQAFASDGSWEANLRLDSAIPLGRGLKSSSAVSSAILLAVAQASSSSPSLESVARLSADVSQKIGLSATGAFDDAMASVEGGLVVTENLGRTVIHRGEIGPGLVAVLHIPTASHRPSSEFRKAFRSELASAQGAVESARAGRFFEAMARNTEVIERVLGYDYRSLRERLRHHGAVATGVSGMGPTLAALVPQERAEGVLAQLPKDHAEGRVVPLVPRARLARGLP